MKLTVRQILHLDEIEADRRAIEATLIVALNHHSNQMNELAKREIAMWEQLGEAHGFDSRSRPGWTIKVVDGAPSIVRVADTD